MNEISISPELIKKVVYPPETVVEARVLNLSGSSPEWAKLGAYVPLVELTDIPPRLIKLDQVAYEHQTTVDHKPVVTCRVEGSMAGKPILNDTDSLAKPDIDDYIPFNTFFDETMIVKFKASAEATPAEVVNYKARAVYTVKTPTVADKLALGITKAALTEEERRLDRTYEIQRKIASGELPMPYPKGALIRQMVGTLSKDMVKDGKEKVLEHYVAAGQKVVLTKLWCKRPSAYDNLRIHIIRDKKEYFKIWPWALPDMESSVGRYVPVTYSATPGGSALNVVQTTPDAAPATLESVEGGGSPATLQVETSPLVTLKDRPLELWIPSPSHLKVLTVCTAAVKEDDVRCMAKFEIRKMTIWDKILWGKLSDTRITEDWERDLVDELDLESKAKAGLFVLAVPVNLGGRGE